MRLEPLREAQTKLQLEQQAAQLGGAQYLEQLSAAQVDLGALQQGIEQGGVKLWGLQGEVVLGLGVGPGGAWQGSGSVLARF